jgi:WD40 repeat protein
VLRGSGKGGAFQCAFSHDGRRIAAGFEDAVRVWNADGSGEPLVLASEGPFYAVAFSPDGRLTAMSNEKSIRIVRDGRPDDAVVLLVDVETPESVIFSPDGRRFLAATGKTVRIWSDFAPIEPGDPRLWQATSYCLPVEQMKTLLGVEAEVGAALRARCLERATAGRAAPR